MDHRLRTAHDDVNGELTLGLAPGGSLEFTAGEASVDDGALAQALADRYPNIEYVGAVDGPETGTPDVEPPLDPSEYTVNELSAALAEQDLSIDELRAVRTTEQDGNDRISALDVIDAEIGD